MEEVYYRDSQEFLARQRRKSRLVFIPTVFIMLVPMVALPIVSTFSGLWARADWRLYAILATMEPLFGAQVVLAALSVWRFQATRVTTLGLEPPLRRFRTILRRERELVSALDIDRVRRIQIRNRCCEVVMKDGSTDVVCEHNVEEFDRFWEALKRIAPGAEA